MIYLGNPKKHNRLICTNVPNNLVFNTLQLLLAAGLTSSSFNSLTNCFGFGSPRPPSPAGPMAGRFEVRDLPLGCWVRTVHGDGEQWKCQYPEHPCMLYMDIYGNIYHQYTPNVSIYTIHGSYGIWHMGCIWVYPKNVGTPDTPSIEKWSIIKRTMLDHFVAS